MLMGSGWYLDISFVLRLPGGVLEKAMRDAEGEEVHRI